jgi:hypothetical protein
LLLSPFKKLCFNAKKCVGQTFWATFLKTHLVTLIALSAFSPFSPGQEK